MSSSLKRCALGLTVLFTLTVHAQQPQTVRQGVYTAAQANRGQAVYTGQCALCHGDTLEGVIGPPLAGDEFLAVWDKKPLSELFGKIKNTMPQNDPGKLTAQQTADLVAYMLQVGKFPEGGAELRGDEAALKQITWPAGTPAQPAASAAAQTASFPPLGNMSQVMRGIMFPNANILFTVQTHDPAEKKPIVDVAAGGFDWFTWGGGLYSGWESVDYAAIAIAESAPLILTPGRRCENGRPVPVNEPEWVKFTLEMAEAGKAAYKASQSRNQEAVSDVTNVISDACLHCHQVYRDNSRRGGATADLTNSSQRCVNVK